MNRHQARHNSDWPLLRLPDGRTLYATDVDRWQLDYSTRERLRVLAARATVVLFFLFVCLLSGGPK